MSLSKNRGSRREASVQSPGGTRLSFAFRRRSRNESRVRSKVCGAVLKAYVARSPTERVPERSEVNISQKEQATSTVVLATGKFRICFTCHASLLCSASVVSLRGSSATHLNIIPLDTHGLYIPDGSLTLVNTLSAAKSYRTAAIPLT